MTNNGVYSNEPRPRLCHLRRWPDFTGYGFNLHCEKAKPGQFIGKVDQNSPASSAGLRENDRIIEVNYVPIGNENHKQVVARIKEGVSRNGVKYPDEVILLVLDPDADEFYKHKTGVVRSSDANVDKLETEIRNGSENGDISPQSSNRSSGKVDSPIIRQTPPSSRTKPNEFDRDYKHVTDFTGPTITQHTKNAESPAISRTSDRDYRNDDNTYLPSSPPISEKDKRKEISPSNMYTNTSSSPKSPARDSYAKSDSTSPPRISPSNGSAGGLELAMSAAEYREKLKEKSARKRDPRQDQQMSMKQKHDFIDRL
ncbi:unnamed protein product [Adineta steineri]|uniref:PDZ domain-containing protein n=1 Tax=Adineta steineri TaxID=433720 RepID=A0A813QAD6_9BILA|nr:unnamed protein product [Adineta steineri]CAF3547362.1 unnamed protein product [Adineta steineri]